MSVTLLNYAQIYLKYTNPFARDQYLQAINNSAQIFRQTEIRNKTYESTLPNIKSSSMTI